MQCPILPCFVVYTPTQYAISCKITEILILPDSKKSKYYLGTQMLEQNFSKYHLSEKICNAPFYFVLEYIHQLSMLSHVKYRNSNFT